jgi:hypothetical protein
VEVRTAVAIELKSNSCASASTQTPKAHAPCNIRCGIYSKIQKLGKWRVVFYILPLPPKFNFQKVIFLGVANVTGRSLILLPLATIHGSTTICQATSYHIPLLLRRILDFDFDGTALV